MRFIICGLLLLCTFACKTKNETFSPAETGLDAGRNFVEACLKGDFLKANYYMLQNDKNIAFLGAEEAKYREADKEGRQQLRTASINIKGFEEPTDSTAILSYSNTVDTTSKHLYIQRFSDGWKVDLKKSFE